MNYLSPNFEGDQAEWSKPWGLEPGRLWSLWDMINYTVSHLCFLLRNLEAEERWASVESQGNSSLGDTLSQRMTTHELISSATLLGINPEMDAVRIRAGAFSINVLRDMSWGDYAYELRALRETIQGQLQGIHLYRYPKDKARMILEVGMTWQKASANFPSAKPEIAAGVDCYAIGHNTACVFHMMRVAEAALRVLAKERGVQAVRSVTPVEYGTWNDVIKAIETALATVKAKTAGPKKDAALAFYHRAFDDMRTLQDLYRDRTMHLRESYDDGQAQSAMFRVRSLLDGLADKGLSEDAANPIDWEL